MTKPEITYKIIQDWVRLIRNHVADLKRQEDLLVLLLDWHRGEETFYIQNGEIKDLIPKDKK